jgi:hypothetical protein
VNTGAGCMWLRLRTMANYDVNYVETSGFITKCLASYQLNANCEMRINFLLRVSLHQMYDKGRRQCSICSV